MAQFSFKRHHDANILNDKHVVCTVKCWRHGCNHVVFNVKLGHAALILNRLLRLCLCLCLCSEFAKSLFADKENPRGALNFFSGRGLRPGFPKCGACELTFASETGGLWAENFQIWELVSWKFPNLGACELKFGWILRLLRLKFPNFL